MQSVIDFNESRKLEAKKKLNAYVLKNKNNFIFPDNNWDDNIWNITKFLKNKIIDTKSKKVYFRSVRDNSLSKSSINISISEPLVDFAKAMFCEIMRVKKLSEFRRIIYAIQALEFALLEQKVSVCITEINVETLNLAESYLRSTYKDP